MSKYGSLLKKVEIFEKLAVYGNKQDFLKILGQTAPKLPINDTLYPNKSIVTNKDLRGFDAGGFPSHDEMIDESEDELSPEEIKNIEDAKNKLTYASMDELVFKSLI